MTTIASTYGAAGTYTVSADNTTATASNAGSSAATGNGQESPKAENKACKALSDRFEKLVQIIFNRKGSSLSFRDLRKEAEKLEDEFDKQVKGELKKLGVDTDRSFHLRYDEKTRKMICSKHPDKEKIEAYFRDNPGRVSQFRDMVDLRSVTGFAQKKMSPQLFRQQMHYLSMSIWMNSMGDSMNNFMGGSVNMSGAGSSFYRGLNLQV